MLNNCIDNLWDFFSEFYCYRRKPSQDPWKAYLAVLSIDSDTNSDNSSVIIDDTVDNWNVNIEMAHQSVQQCFIQNK